MGLEEKEHLGRERMSQEGPVPVPDQWFLSLVVTKLCWWEEKHTQGFGTGHTNVMVPTPGPCSVPLMTSRQLNWN